MPDNMNAASTLFQESHIRAYEDSDGMIGHEWQPGLFTLVLHTIGRTSGAVRKFAVIYLAVGDSYVLVASRGGANTHPNWYLNLVAHPDVRVQVGSRRLDVRARTAEESERARLWPRLVDYFPTFADYQLATRRVIPVVILTPDERPADAR